MATIASFSDALDVLKDYLVETIAVDTDFQIQDSQESPYLHVVKLQKDPTEVERAGLAHILLSGTDEHAPDWGFYARRATVTASCRASEFAGALEGVENTEAFQEKIARKLQLLIESDYATIRDLGLLKNETTQGRSGALTSTELLSTVHFVDVTVGFIYLTKDEN